METGRIIAFDHGSKRTGLAVSDVSQTFAFGLAALPTADVEGFIEKYLAEHEVVAFIVGEPKRMNNEPSQSAPLVEAFVNRLKKRFPGIPVHRMDERFTSKIAARTILESGVKKKDRRDKGMVDQVSATIILQSWLERIKT